MRTGFDRWLWIWISVVITLALIGSGLWHVRGRASRASEALESLRREVATVHQQLAESDALQLSRMDAEIAATRERIDRYRSELAPATAEESAIDPIFAVARFVEEARRALSHAGIEVRANEQFGFGAEGDRVSPVVRLDQIAAHRLVVDTLCASGPARLLSLEPSAKDDLGKRNPSQSRGERYPSSGNEGMPAEITSAGCRVEISVSPSTLRKFLQRLSREPRVVVRKVEIEGGASGRTHAVAIGVSKPSGASVPWLNRVAIRVEVLRPQAGEEAHP